MRISNIRVFSTPLVIGAGIFVATTGVFMFSTTTDLVRFAHEWLGVCFAVGIVLHILTNWRPFKRYFAQRGFVIIALAWAIGIGLLTSSALQHGEDAEEVVFERIEQTPIQQLAPLVGVEVSQLLDQLAADGFTVETPEISVEQLAETHATDTDDILLSIFQ